MTEQQLETTLQSAIEHAAPDRLDAILSRCSAQESAGAAKKASTSGRRRRRFVPWLVAACLALLVVGGVTIQQATAVASVISLDVNPSFELRINSSEKVLSCAALNPDAQQVLGDMDLSGTPLDVAVNAIIGSLVQNGYLDSISSAILISVEDNDTQRASRLQANLTSQVDTALQNASANASILSQTFTQDASLESQAQQNNISVGKAALIQGILALNSSLNFNDLAALSVEELQQLQEAGAPGMPIGREQAAYAAQEYAGVLEVSAITWDVDPELDEYPAHYEVELYAQFGEFEYVVDAYTGEILRGQANVLESSGGTSTTTPSTGRPSSTGISADEAKSAALAAAGLSESQVTALTVKGDYDDGRLEYDVTFWYNSTEYEFEIDGTSGTVLKQEQESHASAPSGDLLSSEAARDAALAHAGLSLDDIYDLDIEAELDERIPHYSVDFKSGRMEYEYEINASTGEVLAVEQDYDD